MERKYRRRALSKRSVFADPFFVDSPSEKGGGLCRAVSASTIGRTRPIGSV